jgi:hypothetical protein
MNLSKQSVDKELLSGELYLKDNTVSTYLYMIYLNKIIKNDR